MRLAETQFSLIERSQALDRGMSPATIKHRLRAGRWQLLLPRVYMVSGTPVRWETKAMAAVLWAGRNEAALSHRAAARRWGMPGFEDASVEISTLQRKSSKEFIVHHAPDLARHDMVLHDGLPVTSIHRTLVDIGDVSRVDVVEDALDDAIRRGLTAPGYLLKQIDRIGCHGRRGASMLRNLLVGEETRPSWLERRLTRLLAKTELPPYVREHRALRYRIDFAWPGAMLGVEVHGEKFHRKRGRWHRDLARHSELTATGWTILHFTWAEIRDEPDLVVAQIVSTYRRLAGLQI